MRTTRRPTPLTYSSRRACGLNCWHSYSAMWGRLCSCTGLMLGKPTLFVSRYTQLTPLSSRQGRSGKPGGWVPRSPGGTCKVSSRAAGHGRGHGRCGCCVTRCCIVELVSACRQPVATPRAASHSPCRAMVCNYACSCMRSDRRSWASAIHSPNASRSTLRAGCECAGVACVRSLRLGCVMWRPNEPGTWGPEATRQGGHRSAKAMAPSVLGFADRASPCPPFAVS